MIKILLNKPRIIPLIKQGYISVSKYFMRGMINDAYWDFATIIKDSIYSAGTNRWHTVADFLKQPQQKGSPVSLNNGDRMEII